MACQKEHGTEGENQDDSNLPQNDSLNANKEDVTETEEEHVQIVLGELQSFGATGGCNSDHMPNIKECVTTSINYKLTKKDKIFCARFME